MKVWKFPVKVDDYGHEAWIEAPQHATVLHFACQGDNIVAWALVEPANRVVRRDVIIAGTGHDVPGGRYVNTFFDGPFVWHGFDFGDSAGRP